MILLTARELEVTRMYAAGLTIKEISRRLERARPTTDRHLTRAITKMGLGRDRRAIALKLDDVSVGCVKGLRKSPNSCGLMRGDQVSITGGRFAGRSGTFLRLESCVQAAVEIGMAKIMVRRYFLQKQEQRETDE